MRRGVGEFASGVIGSPFHALCDRLQAQAPNSVKLVQPAVMHALREAGWVDCGRLASADFQTKKHIFCRPDLAGSSKSTLRRIAEGLPAVSLPK